jgi:phosphoribosyl-AMP cyclohydrolase
MTITEQALGQVNWNEQGLIPAVAQDHASGKVLMLAWMNREALACTLAEGRAVYWSRSRGKLWRKGEESGHVQRLLGLRLDCDRDAILLSVEQIGGIACHTGRESCFFFGLRADGWQEMDSVAKDPCLVYGGHDG